MQRLSCLKSQWERGGASEQQAFWLEILIPPQLPINQETFWAQPPPWHARDSETDLALPGCPSCSSCSGSTDPPQGRAPATAAPAAPQGQIIREVP